VALIGTGGTIAEAFYKGKPTMLTARELVESVPSIASIATVVPVDAVVLPSPAIDFQTLLDLSKKIDQVITTERPDGIVVTSGTDTLEENAYFLDLALNTELPLVITGAMRSRLGTNSDSEFNLHNAFVAASSDCLRDAGAVVAMNGELHQARYVMKTHTSSVSSFQSPGYGPLGAILENRVKLYAKPPMREYIRPSGVAPRVDLFKVCSGMDGSLIEAAIKLGAKGMVVEGFGPGDLTPGAASGIKNALMQGVTVVIVSRTLSGLLYEASLDFEGSLGSMRRLGAIGGSATTGLKARVKLMVALSAGMNPKAIRDAFEN
jgi:L-asparaginase